MMDPSHDSVTNVATDFGLVIGRLNQPVRHGFVGLLPSYQSRQRDLRYSQSGTPRLWHKPLKYRRSCAFHRNGEPVTGAKKTPPNAGFDVSLLLMSYSK
jgi:hypothetical protein